MLREQHERVQQQPEPGRHDDRPDRREQREQHRRQDQREADAAGRLNAGGQQSSRCHQDEGHPSSRLPMNFDACAGPNEQYETGEMCGRCHIQSRARVVQIEKVI